MGNKHTRSRRQSKVAAAHGSDQPEQARQPPPQNAGGEERVTSTARAEESQKVRR